MKPRFVVTYLLKLLLSIYLVLPYAIHADVVYNENLTVQGNLCVGLDCIINETFNIDTLIIKENNLRIHFKDTVSANTDLYSMMVTVNDSSNEGLNYFSLDHLFDAGGDEIDIVSTKAMRVTSELDGASQYVSSFTLGQDSTETLGTISVGSTSMLRQIKHLALGINATDALIMQALTNYDVMVNQKLVLADIQLQLDSYSAAITEAENLVTQAESENDDNPGGESTTGSSSGSSGGLGIGSLYPMTLFEYVLFIVIALIAFGRRKSFIKPEAINLKQLF